MTASPVTSLLATNVREPAPGPRRRRLSFRWKLLFALVPVTALVVTGELCARSYRAGKGLSPFMVGSYRDQRIDLIRRGYPAAHDALLGYVPRAGVAGNSNRWGKRVSIDEHGLRRNGMGPHALGQACVLAVGDSFTFGDQVADEDTWPARLEQAIKRPVLNGGVFGYSFAQTVLRAEQLMARFPVDCLVVSLIRDDLSRCELSKRFTPVPWYDLVNGELVLKNVPVPDSDKDNEMDRQYVRKLLGYSALLDMLFWNSVPEWWVGDQREVRQHEHGVGREIGKKLLDRLAAECKDKGVRLLVVMQGSEVEKDAMLFVEYAREIGVEVLDLMTRFVCLAERDPNLRRKYFAGHMTAAGNAWVAGEIAAVFFGM